MYFKLNPECYLIKGEKCGAIFDLIDAKIYALDREETEVVTFCENGNPIAGDEKLLHELKRSCLGNFYLNPTYVQKLRTDSFITNRHDPIFPIAPPALYRVFLEINNSCHRDCWFCGYYGIKRSLGCMGCNKWNENAESLTTERWKGIVDELRDLECRDLFITGGDLTLDWDQTMEILDHATQKFGNIYVVLHHASVTSDIMADLDMKANIVVQCDNIDEAIFENATNLLVVAPQNWEKANNIGDKNLIKDFLIETKKNLPRNFGLNSKEKISAPNIYRFLNNIEYHPCLGHTLAIGYSGNIIPCPMMRTHSFGNLKDREIWSIFKENLKHITKFWRMNLDVIEKCTCCEFRYSCTDCRALEENLSGRLNGKVLCNYNPNEGEWL